MVPIHYHAHENMSLTHLNIHHVRNLACARLESLSRFNVIYGANGSGKTSLLEAIYLLSCGHSFRTREVSPLIQQGEESLTVYAKTCDNQSVSLQKTLAGVTRVKLNQQPCQRSSDLAHFLPCQAFYQDIFQIMDAGPSVRRSLLDWGVFHVKHSYHGLLKDYRRVLKQRNALLRQKATQKSCAPWDAMLVELSYALDTLRLRYFSEWSELFQSYLSRLTGTVCSVHYFKGWDKKNTGKDLSTYLLDQFGMDLQRQYTHSGAHQADFYFESDLLKAKYTLSRGQQKIILIALKLAQSHLLSKPCLYLFDDIAAELDQKHVQRLLACLSDISGQFFMTTLEPHSIQDALAGSDLSMFSLVEGVLV